MNRIHKYCILLVFLTAGISVQAQLTDLARIEYTWFPQKHSDNSFRRFRTLVNFPLKLNDKGAYIIPGLEYRNTNLRYDDPATFQTNELDRFESFAFSLGYTFKINDLWRFGTQGGVLLASNFETGKVVGDDLIFTGAVIFVKIKEDPRFQDPLRLILGLSYSTTSGLPLPLPIVNYYKRFEPNWAYAVGTPKTNLTYFINEKSNVEAFVTLDGFFANIQKNFPVNSNISGSTGIANNFSMTIVLAGLGYEYSFNKYLSLYFYGGHTIINDIRLRDNNLNKVYTINDTNSFYGRSGLKFSIL